MSGPFPGRCQYCRSRREIVAGRLRICGDCGFNFHWEDRALTHRDGEAAGISPTLKHNGGYWKRIVLANDPCAYCGVYPGLNPDHIEPRPRSRKRHGKRHNVWDNITAACRRCNWEKGDTALLLFLVRPGAPSRETP